MKIYYVSRKGTRICNVTIYHEFSLLGVGLVCNSQNSVQSIFVPAMSLPYSRFLARVSTLVPISTGSDYLIPS